MIQQFLFLTNFYLKFSFFCISFLLLILVPIIGVEVKGSKRWLDLFFLPRLQPIELVKPFFIIVLSLIITYEKLSNFTLKFVLSFLLTLLILAIYFLTTR